VDHSPAAVRQTVEAISTKGDAKRGEAIYRRAELQCLNCHGIHGVGANIGPDLGSIGASAQMDYIVESLWLPNKAVKEGYHTFTYNLESGRSLSGIPIRQSKELITVRQSDGKEIDIPTGDIAQSNPARSMMPEGLLDSLSSQDSLDLFRFLMELGKGEYATPKTRDARVWQVVEGTPDNANLLRRSRAASAAEPANALLWNARYSRVSGELHIEDLPSLTVWNGSAAQSIVRTQFEVTKAGPVKFAGDFTGVDVYANGAVFNPSTGFDASKGVLSLVLIVDRSKRTTPIAIRLEETANGATVTPVLGR
jgi:putative heme-binding domain-containing protein